MNIDKRILGTLALVAISITLHVMGISKAPTAIYLATAVGLMYLLFLHIRTRQITHLTAMMNDSSARA